MKKHNAYALLKRFAFERVSGSQKELEAARFLLEECKNMHVRAWLEPFAIPSPQITEV